jgi:hypothetical protein
VAVRVPAAGVETLRRHLLEAYGTTFGLTEYELDEALERAKDHAARAPIWRDPIHIAGEAIERSERGRPPEEGLPWRDDDNPQFGGAPW